MVSGKGLPDPAKRTLRCGPWADGRCQKCGRPDPLDFPDVDDEHVEASTVAGPWVDDLVRNLVTTIQVHDEPMPGHWFCGRCPYMNSGVICTKCGAPRYEGTAFDA